MSETSARPLLLRVAATITAVTLVGVACWAVVALLSGPDIPKRPAPPPAEGPPPPPQIQPAPVTMPSPDGGPDRVVVGALPADSTSYAAPIDARYVAPGGSNRSDGSREQPWRTVEHAVEASPDGSVIVLRAGEYKESVRIVAKQLTLQSAPGEEVWFDGSIPVENFVPTGSGLWRADDWTAAPERLDPDSHLLSHDRPESGWPDQVFLDGEQLQQTPALADVGEGTFFVDPEADTLYIGSDPTGHQIRASTLGWALYFDHADGSRLLGIGVRRYATPESKLAPIRIHCDDAVVENVVSEDNAYAGISVIGRGNTVRQSTMRRNGQLGVQARYADGLYLGRSLLEDNNTQGFEQTQQAGGAKVTASRGIQLEDNLVKNNAGAGLWMDQSVYGATVLRNATVRNERSGIMVELSAEVLVAGNVSTLNGVNGVYVLESSDVRVFNNALVQNGAWNLWVLDGDRTSSDPASSDFDRRFPSPDQRISFDVHRVTVRNNVIADDAESTGRSRALLGVDDVSGDRSARQMGVTSDNNAFWRRSAASSDDFSTWAAYPQPVQRSATLKAHQKATGQDRSSRYSQGGVNPYVVGDGALLRPGTTGWQQHGGSPVPEDVRTALGVDAADHPIGLPATSSSLVASNR